MAIKINDLCLGEETKLSQKFMGKTVYAKLIDFGALPSANTEKSVPHGITNMDQFGIDNSRSFVDQGNGNRHALFYPNTVENAFWRAKVNESDVAIQVGQAREGFSAVICVWYTKRFEIENPVDDQSDYPGEINFTLLGGSGNQKGLGVNRINDNILLAGDSGSGALLAQYDLDLNLSRVQAYSSTYSLVNTIPYNDGYMGYSRIMIRTNDQLTFLSNLSYRPSENGELHRIYATPEDFEGSAAYLTMGQYNSKSFITSLDPSWNVLQSVVCSSSSTVFRRAIIDKDRCVFSGRCDFNSKKSGLITIFNANIQALENIVVTTGGIDYLEHIAKRPGGYVLAGYSTGTGSGKNNIVVVLLDENFDIEKKIFVNGSGAETLTDMQLDQAGNIVIVGTTTSVTAGGTDGLFMVFDPDLNIKTQHTFGGTKADSYESVYINNPGNYLLAGTTSSTPNSGSKAFVLNLVGKVADLHGSIQKYPALRFNALPGFTTSDQFTLAVHRNVTLTHSVKSLTINSPTITMKNTNITQDPGAVI